MIRILFDQSALCVFIFLYSKFVLPLFYLTTNNFEIAFFVFLVILGAAGRTGGQGGQGGQGENRRRYIGILTFK